MPLPSSGKNALVILDAETVQAAATVVREIERLGGHILHVYPPRVLIGEVPAEAEAQVKALANVRSLHRSRVDLAEVASLGADAVRAVRGWNRGFSASLRALKSGRPGEGKSWGAPGYAPEGPVQPPRGVDPAGAHSPSAASSRGRASDTSAYLIGKVAVNLVLVEGQAPAFALTPMEQDTVVAEVQDGLGWLGSIEPKANVTWFYEVRHVQVEVDPAQDPSFSEDTWRDAAMSKLGYPASWAGLEQFVRDRRIALGTDWSMVIFVTRFPLWHFAYAYKPRVVMGYDMDGWGVDDMDRVAAHETAHLFGASDEYAESKCDCRERFGFLQVENGNCELCAPSHVPCIMSHNTWAMCDYTRAHLGWRDSNGDGTLDPLDRQPIVQRPWWLELLDRLRAWLGLTPAQGA
ncbi:MAG: hypothetical protein QME94_06510 [Anaerolineae bacterium]|nr:hypothetical protein [Anaerolineae bacterium]